MVKPTWGWWWYWLSWKYMVFKMDRLSNNIFRLETFSHKITIVRAPSPIYVATCKNTQLWNELNPNTKDIKYTGDRQYLGRMRRCKRGCPHRAAWLSHSVATAGLRIQLLALIFTMRAVMIMVSDIHWWWLMVLLISIDGDKNDVGVTWPGRQTTLQMQAHFLLSQSRLIVEMLQ